MAEKIKADTYIAYLDQLLAGKKDIGPVNDIEIEKLLQLTQTMINADLSLNSKLRESLREQLLDAINSNPSTFSRNEDELDEEDLENVTAAGQVGNQKEICPYCSSRSVKLEGRCPFCNC